MRSPTRRIGVSKLATVTECLTAQGTHVAVKQFDKQPLSAFQHDKIFSAAARWQKLSAPGLISYQEVLPAENQIVMELMDRSAATRLNEGYSDPRLVSFVLRGVLSALASIHEQGMLHVNIKPTNVFFDESGRAKLSDGLLVPINQPGTLPPPTNQKYLTPEHTSDAFGQMSVATDLYAAGFLALELLAGERFGRAFQGIGDDTPNDNLAWFQWHGSSQDTPLATQFCKTCPPQLEAVIARLTKKNPAERYPSAMAAIAELPSEAPPASTTANKQPMVTAVEVKRAAFASDVIERPATGVVLAIASGPRAGEMFGTNDTEFFIGFHPDCMLRFSSEQYPSASGKVMCRRGSEGWMVSRVSGDNLFVNQRLLEDKLVLRSGDVIRLSARGPDVQFTMQSGGLAIKSLVSRFLPAQSSQTGANQVSGRTTAAPGVEPKGAPRPPGSAVPAHVAQAGQGGVAPAAPRRPGSPAAPVAPSAPRRDAAPVRAMSAAPVAPQSPAAPRSPTAAPAAFASQPALRPTDKEAKRKADADAPKGPWSQPKSWNKNQKNTAVAVIGSLIVIALVIMVPTSPSKDPNKSKESAGAGVVETESENIQADQSKATAEESEAVTTNESAATGDSESVATEPPKS